MFLMIIASWNVRGINSPSKRVDIKRWVKKSKADIVILVETKVKVHSEYILASLLGPN